jgi:tetratricopeptide (TPR) repeat protein
VLSDFTALLVLETEQDYERYGIDRRGLVDILSVGDSGIEVLQDRKLVVAAATAQGAPEIPDVARSRRALEKPAAEPPAAAGQRSRNAPPPAPAESDKKQEQGYGYEFSDDPMSQGEAADSDSALRSRPAPPRAPSAPPAAAVQSAPMSAEADEEAPAAEPSVREALLRDGPPALSGPFAEIARLIRAGDSQGAVVAALDWRTRAPGDVMALVALGEALEAHGNLALAARAYGSIIDLFPARADLRRFAGERLDRLGAWDGGLAVDSYAKALEQRPDHLSGHRLLGLALTRQQRFEAAFTTLEAGLRRPFPPDRFAGGRQVMLEDLGLVAAAWLARDPARRSEVERRLQAAGATLATAPSLRFVLYWETDANDVDFHVEDGRGGDAFYGNPELASGGRLYADVTTGYGPELFAITGKASAFPYRLGIHYYSRGPMGYGMGKVEVLEHDGRGGLRFGDLPFVVMNDDAFVDLGELRGSLFAGKRPVRRVR